MKKRIYMRGVIIESDFKNDYSYYMDVEENLIRYENDGVSVLRVRAGDPEYWIPNWRVIEVADAHDDAKDEAVLSMERFAPVTLEDLAAVPGSVEHGVFVAAYDLPDATGSPSLGYDDRSDSGDLF